MPKPRKPAADWPSGQRGVYTAEQLFGGSLGGCSNIHWHATEKANKNASKAGRKQWNDEDQDVYFAAYYWALEMLAPNHPAVADYKRSLGNIGHNGGPVLEEAA